MHSDSSAAAGRPLSWVILHAVLFTPHHNHVQTLLLFLIYRKLSLAQVFPHQICFSLKCYEIFPYAFSFCPHNNLLIPRAGILLPLVRMRSLEPTGPRPSGGFGCPPQHRCPPVVARFVGRWWYPSPMAGTTGGCVCPRRFWAGSSSKATPQGPACRECSPRAHWNSLTDCFFARSQLTAAGRGECSAQRPLIWEWNLPGS